MLFTLYTCKEALQRLDDYLDRELTPKEMKWVARHLKLCHACSRKFAFEQTVQDELRAKLQRIALPEDLREKVMAALREADKE